jgi:hypothetical protein
MIKICPLCEKNVDHDDTVENPENKSQRICEYCYEEVLEDINELGIKRC